MIHAYDDVVPTAPGFGKHAVRRHRSTHIEALGACLLDGRDNLFDLFAAKEAVFARVGIEARHGDARLCYAQIAATFVSDADDVQDTPLFHAVTRLAQGDMRRDVHHTQIVVCQHHRVLVRMRIMGVYFRVPGKVVAGKVDSFLVQSIGDRSVNLATHCQLDNFLDALECRFAAHR